MGCVRITAGATRSLRTAHRLDTDLRPARAAGLADGTAGDRVITTTLDASGVDAQGRQAAQGPNPETGPFYVEGAEPDDRLVVTFEKIETNRATAYSGSLLAADTVDPASMATRQDRDRKRVTWQIDKAAGVARLTHPDVRPATITWPLRPMLGCVAVAPARKEAIVTPTPGAFGGNMHDAGVTSGVTVMLSVNDGVSERGAAGFMGQALEYEIANVVDPDFTVVAKVQQALLPPR